MLQSVILEGYWSSLSSIVLQWSVSSGAAGYRVYVNGVPQSQVLTQRSANITGLLLSTPYLFNVVAVDGSNNDASVLSNPVPFEHGVNEIGAYFPTPGVPNFNIDLGDTPGPPPPPPGPPPVQLLTIDTTLITIDSTLITADATIWPM